MTIRRLGLSAAAILGVAIAVHIYALINDLYFQVPWIDIPMHFFGGVGTGFFALFIAALFGLLPLDSPTETQLFGVQISFEPEIPWWWSALITLSVVAIIGLAWEVHEVFLLAIQDMPIPSGYVLDTLKDLTNDSLGGLVTWRAFRTVQWSAWSVAEMRGVHTPRN